MGQVQQQRRFWTITNLFMVRDFKEFEKWIDEIVEAYGEDISITIRTDTNSAAKLNELATAINNVEERKYLLRPKDAVFHGLYIEGEIPTVRMKSVNELTLEGEKDIEEPEVRDIDFLEELSGHLYDGEVAMVTTVGVDPATMVSARGFIVTSTGVTLCPTSLPAYLFELSSGKSKYLVNKLNE